MNGDEKAKARNIRSIPKSAVNNDDKLSKALSSSRQRTQGKREDGADQSRSRGPENSSRILRTALSSARDVGVKSRVVDSQSYDGNRKREATKDDLQRDTNPGKSDVVSTKKIRGENGPVSSTSQSTITVPEQFLESMKNYAIMSGFRSFEDMMKAYQTRSMPPGMIPPFMMGYPPMPGPMGYPPFPPPMGSEFFPPGPVPMGFPPMPGWIPPGLDMPLWQFPSHENVRGQPSFRGGRFPGRGRSFGGRGPVPQTNKHSGPQKETPEKTGPNTEAAPASSSSVMDTAPDEMGIAVDAQALNQDAQATESNTNDRFSGRGRGFVHRGRGRGPPRGFSGRSFRGRMPFPPTAATARNKVWVRESDLENPLVANR